MSEGRCAHEGCACPRRAPHAYCGAYCANAEETEALPGEADLPGSCACGHAACKAEREPSLAGPEIVTSIGRE